MGNHIPESGEFYRQHLWIPTWKLIIPIVIFIIVMSAIFGLTTREVSVFATGKITLQQPAAIISTQVHDKIIHNYLHDNQLVTKGQKLLVYNSSSQKLQLKQHQQQKQLVHNQLIGLQLLIKSVKQNKKLIDQQKMPLLAELYQAYQGRCQVYQLQNSFAVSSTASTKAQILHNLNASQQIYQKQLHIQQKLLRDLQQNRTLSDADKHNYLINITNSKVSQKLVQQQIAQLQLDLKNIALQREQFTYGQYNSDTNQQNIIDLQNEQLDFYNSMFTVLTNQQAVNRRQIKDLQQQNQQVTLRAPTSGIVHLLNINSNQTIQWAQIDPPLVKNKPLIINLTLSKTQTAVIKPGQRVVLSLSHQLLKGKIITCHDNQVTARMSASALQKRHLRLGEVGSGSIIVEHQSWWRYFINQLL